MIPFRAGWTFYLLLFAITPAAFFFHELAHWLAGETLGYSMTMSLNNAHPVEGAFRTTADAMWVSAAGPLLTILQGTIAYLLVRRTGNPLFYPVIFIALFMRASAMLISGFNLNDEARISHALGIGEWTLPAVVVAGLLALTWRASLRIGAHWSVNVYSYLVASLAVTAVVWGDAVITGTRFLPGN